MKLVISIFFIVNVLVSFGQQTPSPEAFLGYPIGSHYSRHHQIVDYFRTVANSQSNKVKLAEYGKTPEGRPLLVAIVSDEANLQKLNDIQQQNLAIVNGTAPQTQLPAIVWLSYNVHGNEPASSEAAMLALYELVTSQSTAAKDWLKNTVVIIDPCLNPDGRDRYVNWFNNAVGTSSNSDPQAREHDEPWPSGRTNHYNFDLNRDWAWQTQIESQQRAKLYQQWYPHVHVDFHEQGCNEPYYFAPAANPIHAAVTPWQNEFQVKVGTNNAAYFDKNAWLFFTKERFDLLYPSYGDTYPMYNGAIGMTYEQGGIGGGLMIETDDHDVLTLQERVQHHFQTSMSTVEVSSKHGTQLINEFNNYYQNSRAGKSASYKSYVLTAETPTDLAGFENLLRKNNIAFIPFTGNAPKGFHFQTQKEETFVDKGYSIVVSMQQAHSVLANVLLEPTTTLTDSNTYDITAWSLPFAYGIDCYGLKTVFQPKVNQQNITSSDSIGDYGCILPYSSFHSTKLLAALLKAELQVRYTEVPFTTQGKTYAAGTLIVLKTNQQSDWKNRLLQVCKEFQVSPISLSTGLSSAGPDMGSPSIKVIPHAPKVAFFTGEGISALSAGEVWSYFDNTLNYPVTQLLAKNVSEMNLSTYDVIIVPNGSFISTEHSEQLRVFTNHGGTLIVLENSAKQLFSDEKWGVKMKQIETEDSLSITNLPAYGNAERDYLKTSTPGALYKVYLDSTHPLSYGLSQHYYDLKQNTELVEINKDQWNVGTIRKDSHTAGFIGSEAKKQLTEGVIFGEKQVGQGSVIFMTDSPLFRNFWESGLHLMGNAIFFHGK